MKLIFTFLTKQDELVKKEFDYDEIILRSNNDKNKHKISLLKETSSLQDTQKENKNNSHEELDYDFDTPEFINNPEIDSQLSYFQDEQVEIKESQSNCSPIFSKKYIDVFDEVFSDKGVNNIKGIYCPLVSPEQPILINKNGKIIWVTKMRTKLNLEIDKFLMKK